MQENTKRRRTLPASQLFSAMPPFEAVKVFVSIMMSVSLSNKGKPLKLRHYDISRAHFQGTVQKLIYIKLPAEDRQKLWRRQSGQTGQQHVRNSRCFHIWQLDYANLICGESEEFLKRPTQCSTVPQLKRRCVNGSAWRRLCVFVR